MAGKVMKPKLQATDETSTLRANGRRWAGRHTLASSRRDEILRSVGDVLRHSRSSSLTMRSIADELGITKGNLYYYFRDKQDILYHCHMRCMELSLEALQEVLAVKEIKRAQVQLHAILVRHISAILQHGVGNILLTDLEHLTPEQRTSYVEKRDQFESGIRTLIEDGVGCGEFECDNIKLASLTLLGAINWSSKWYRPNGELSLEQVAQGMATFLLRALISQSGGAPKTASAARSDRKREPEL
jgi:AcrR family transcriptional regulator